MIAEQLLSLVQQFAFVLSASALVTPPQLRQYLYSCPLAHRFVHFGHGNNHFWRNVSFSPALHLPPGNKTFGAIRSLWCCAEVLACKHDSVDTVSGGANVVKNAGLKVPSHQR